jgi:drug/metabolite transporter (DMT)-like permease
MGITFLLWSAALKQAENVSRVANLIFLAPVLSLVLIQWVLGEAIHPATLIGFACIVPAVIFQQRST